MFCESKYSACQYVYSFTQWTLISTAKWVRYSVGPGPKAAFGFTVEVTWSEINLLREDDTSEERRRDRVLWAKDQVMGRPGWQPLCCLDQHNAWVKKGQSREQMASLVVQMVKNPPAIRETQVRSLGWRRSPGEVNGNPLQYSCRENPRDRGTWPATVHGVAKSRTQLSN